MSPHLAAVLPFNLHPCPRYKALCNHTTVESEWKETKQFLKMYNNKFLRYIHYMKLSSQSYQNKVNFRKNRSCVWKLIWRCLEKMCRYINICVEV